MLGGSKPAAQSAWRLDFREDGYEAFLRPGADDEREFELNLFCDELQPGRLFMSVEIHGPALAVQSAISNAIIRTDLFSWTDFTPIVRQLDELVTEVVHEIPSHRIRSFLSDARTLSWTAYIRPPYQTMSAETFLSGSRKNLIFAANNCINQR